MLTEDELRRVGITVTQSELTGHWVVNHGQRDAEGFRTKAAADAAAQERGESSRWMLRRG